MKIHAVAILKLSVVFMCVLFTSIIIIDEDDIKLAVCVSVMSAVIISLLGSLVFVLPACVYPAAKPVCVCVGVKVILFQSHHTFCI